MVRRLCPIDQQQRRFSDIKHEDVHLTIVIHITESCATARRQWQVGQARNRRDILKSAISIISKQEEGLAIRCAALDKVHLRIDVPVGYEDVEPSVIVHIKERSTPSHEGVAGLAYVRGVTDVRETLFAPIPVKRVGFLREICDEDVEQSIMVDIAKIHAHRALFATVSTQGRA